MPPPSRRLNDKSLNQILIASKSSLVTAYCYENVTFPEMGYLAKRCSAAPEAWPGDGLGHIFLRTRFI